MMMGIVESDDEGQEDQTRIAVKEKLELQEEKRREFAAIRFFPSLVEAQTKGFTSNEVIIEDRRTRISKEKREKAFSKAKDRIPKKSISAFHPTKEITSLSDLREQIKKRVNFDKRGPGTPRTSVSSAVGRQSLHQTPFRPPNPFDARDALSCPRGILAKTPYDDDEQFRTTQKSLVARVPEKTDITTWRPVRKKPSHIDTFLHSADIESKVQSMTQGEKIRRRRLTEFKDYIRIQNAVSLKSYFIKKTATVDQPRGMLM